MSATEEAAATEQSEGTVSDETTDSGAHVHAPVIQVLKGEPTDEDLAALVTVFAGAAGGGAAAPGPQERDLWGHPVDKLRYGTSSYQLVTLVDRLHLRR